MFLFSRPMFRLSRPMFHFFGLIWVCFGFVFNLFSSFLTKNVTFLTFLTYDLKFPNMNAKTGHVLTFFTYVVFFGQTLHSDGAQKKYLLTTG